MLYSKNGGEYMAKILIVEDDKRTNMAICEYLKPTGQTLFLLMMVRKHCNYFIVQQ